MKRFRSKLVLVFGLVLLLAAANIASGVGVKPVSLLPPNDNCANAKAVGNVTSLAFDTTNATFDGPGHYIRGPNLWYCYTATCNGCATVSLRGSNFDTKVAAYEGCNCYPSSDDLIKSNDDFIGQQSQITFPVKTGSQYLIEVGGFNPSVKGQGAITISCDAQSSQPVNDDCSNAKQIGNVTEQPFNTTCATFDGPGHFFTSPNLWYRYTAGGTGDVTVSLLGSEYDTALVVYDGGNCYPELSKLIERNDDFGGFLQSQITFRATSGKSYLFEVLGYNSDEVGEGVITVSSTAQPPSTNNDSCQNAKPIGDVTNMAFNTTSATQDGPRLCMTGPNIWYCYTATCTGNVTVNLAGSSFDTMLAVYDGCKCYPTANDMIECNDDFGNSRQSKIVFAATAGSQYMIEVGGYANEKGAGLLTVSCQGVQPPPSTNNDSCQNAKPIGDVTNMAFNTTSATQDGPRLCMTGPNIWYCYTATCTGNVTVNLAGSSYDTMLAVYDGCKCYPTANDMIECNDDAGNSYQSAVTFAATAGSQYLIEIGGYATDKGAGLLTISCQGVVIQNKTDLGDAPDSTNNAHVAMRAYPSQGLLPVVPANYPTVYNDGTGIGPYGPVHLNAQTVAFLGKKITRETEADTGTDEDGVNNIRPSNNTPNQDQGDDGVVFPLSLPSCCWSTFDYVVNVIDPNTDLWVNVWMDWNRDGDWDDTLDCPEGPAPEWAVQNQFLFNLPVGINQITTPAILPWHPDNGREDIWMRITLSGQPWKGGSNPGTKGNAGSGPQAKYVIGETEDYHFTPDLTCSICKDYNGDGKTDMNDLAAFVSEWLENCP